jgi:EAL domain-containing protein (putative c-di-GMP-specific phosphodiesterase class I)
MGYTRKQRATFALLVLGSTLAVYLMVTEHAGDLWVVLYSALLPIGFRMLIVASGQPDPWRTFRAANLWRAMRRGEIVLHYQPLVDTGSGRTSGAEALARWDHPRRGLLAPADWLGATEHRWLERRFCMLVLRAAVEQAATWRAQGRDIVVSVNVSPTSFQANWLPQAVGGLLEQHGLPASYLCVEVTESALDLSDDRSQATADALTAMGVPLALDDFGVGHSSMDRLVGLPIGRLKIDKRFVLQMVRSDRHGAVVRAGIGLGHGLGMVVVAEGVEDRETLRSLLGLRCDIAQGFFFSKALPPEDLEVWMDRQGRTHHPGVPAPESAVLG